MTASAVVIRTQAHDDIFLIQLDDPSGYPRLTRAVIIELSKQLRLFREVPELLGAVLTGTEKCFARALTWPR